MVLLLLLLVPLVELFVIIQVAGLIGGWETLLLLIVVGVAGAWLVKLQGISTMVRVSRAVSERRVPDKELIDGFLILVAAVLLLIPGFTSDLLALGLLFPPTRALVRGPLVKRIKGGPVGTFGSIVGSGGRYVGTFRAGAYEVSGEEAPGPDRPSGGRGPLDASGRELPPDNPEPEP